LSQFAPPLHDGCRTALLPVTLDVKDVAWITRKQMAKNRCKVVGSLDRRRRSGEGARGTGT
jgi:hypothetical protein